MNYCACFFFGRLHQADLSLGLQLPVNGVHRQLMGQLDIVINDERAHKLFRGV